MGFGSGPSVVLLSANVWVARTLEETQLLHLHPSLYVSSGLMLLLNAVTLKAIRCGAKISTASSRATAYDNPSPLAATGALTH